MNGSLGHFKAVLQRRKERLEKAEGRFEERKYFGEISGNKAEFNFKILRKSELERLKAGIRSNIKKDNLKDYLLYAVIFLILFISFYFFMN